MSIVTFDEFAAMCYRRSIFKVKPGQTYPRTILRWTENLIHSAFHAALDMAEDGGHYNSEGFLLTHTFFVMLADKVAAIVGQWVECGELIRAADERVHGLQAWVELEVSSLPAPPREEEDLII